MQSVILLERMVVEDVLPLGALPCASSWLPAGMRLLTLM